MMLLSITIHTYTPPLGRIEKKNTHIKLITAVSLAVGEQGLGSRHWGITPFWHRAPAPHQQVVPQRYVLTSASSPRLDQIQAVQVHAMSLLSSRCFIKQEETCYVADTAGRREAADQISAASHLPCATLQRPSLRGWQGQRNPRTKPTE